jgi:hypothetical protein
VGGARQGGAGQLLEGIGHLARASDAAAARLADLERADDIEELGTMVAGLVVEAEDLLAGLSATGAPGADWRTDLEAVSRRLLEARDLLDDGETADAVALEVIAARDILRRGLREARG